MDKYEISLWEDFPDNTNRSNPSQGIPFLNERKICIIGSDTMTSAARALEPKLVSNVNGTHTFTFRIYYRYNDEITGEGNINPYLAYIINERKVKVLWKDEWYDLVIKKMEEDTQKRSVVCTCEDLFITELSKNGYDLEFNSELQNNSGTALELMQKVLAGSGWQPFENQDRIIQYQEEPVYKVQIQNSFTAIKQSSSGEDATASMKKQTREDDFCLLYQSCIDESCTKIQFLYSNKGYLTEPNDMLVLNGDCYTFDGTITRGTDHVTITTKNNNNEDIIIFDFDVNNSYSSIYRAKRLVNSQLTVFDNLLERYVDVYTDGPDGEEVYGYETTEFSDPTLVINLIGNAKDFKDTKGWSGSDNNDDGLTWQVYPPFTKDSQANTYGDNVEVKSYLKIPNEKTFKNSGLSSNKQYLTPNSADIKNGKLGGFQVGDKYIFRYKAVRTTNETIRHYDSISQEETITLKEVPDVGNYIDDPNTIAFSIGASFNNSYFNSKNIGVTVDNWVEFELTCKTACPANQIENIEIYIRNNSDSSCWIEEIQFFKLSYGIPRYPTDEEPEPEEQRINPGEISLQSIANVVYRYYNPDHDEVEDPQDLQFLYQGKEKSSQYIPKYNNYEKITSIEESKSNRFNILQSIAEKFECWVRFIINHNQETGQILYDEDGLPQKYVQLVEQIGEDTGISFEYGIDLKGIKRTIVSNSIATKAIIIPNDNQFGKNGFCTIARSPLNYCRENFILNFDYYIQQGLLSQEAIENDLYKVNGNNLGYYYYLNKWNRRYDALADEINYKQIELTKQEAEYEVQISNLRAARQKKTSAESDLIRLADANDMVGVNSYAKEHTNNRKVQSLMGTLGQVKETIRNLESSTQDLDLSIRTLRAYIEAVNSEMEILVASTKSLHEQFFKKYSRFIQEGTWQDQNYVNDDDYYLDALEVAYRSSRPQIQYDISLLRLSGLEDFSSKTFDLGDICYVQDKEFFGYEDDGITPYKQRIIISQLTSYFDTPEKDVIKVQNYKTQFDDLFQRITTATQALQFSQGSFERAAGVVKPDKTLSFGLLQDTFDYNKDLVLNSANQQVTWDNTGITVADETNSALKVRIMAGGIFASDDGGNTWKNALRGDGISTDLLTAGRINTSEIYMYDGNNPSFRWDSYGINAYTTNLIAQRNSDGSIKKINGEIQYDKYPFSKYVRFDQYGVYGYAGKEDFVPASEEEIWYRRISTTEIEPNYDMRFGLTWKGFFLHGASGVSSLQIVSEQDANGDDQITFKMTSDTTTSGGTYASLEISTDKDIVLKTQKKDENGNLIFDSLNKPVTVDRIQIGRFLDGQGNLDYGIFVRDAEGKNIFNVSAEGTDSIGGWNLTIDSFYHTDSNNTLGLYSQGNDKVSVQGSTEPLYIVAGTNFGVTIDGKIYAQAGKIGGWVIDASSLSAKGITISSTGSISVNFGEADENGQISSGWKISSDGSAVFHKITADYGKIAGWHITKDSIYNNTTMINSSTLAMYNDKGYDIKTGKIAAYGGNIGGWELSGTGFSSTDGKNGFFSNSNTLKINDVSIKAPIKGTGIYIDGIVSILKTLTVGTAADPADVIAMIDAKTVARLSDMYQNYDPETDVKTHNKIQYVDWLHTNWKHKTPADVGL